MAVSIASFFAGIGGLELGLEAALGAQTVFQVERDPYAVQVLERHWPGVRRHDDITTLRPDEIPIADVWCGGFPCQDISLAGKGEGLDGERSGLWWDWFGLIRAVRPRVLVLENVAALTVRGLGDVLGALASVGFDAEWARIGACDVGAPHRRWRIFIVAWDPDTSGVGCGEGRARGAAALLQDGNASGADVAHSEVGGERPGLRAGQPQGVGRGRLGDGGCAGEHPDPNGRGQQERPEQHGAALEGPADWHSCWGHADGLRDEVARVDSPMGEPIGEGLAQWEWAPGERPHSAAAGAGWWAAEPRVGRVAHGVPARVDRLRCLGNAVVPQVAHRVGLRVRELLEAQR